VNDQKNRTRPYGAHRNPALFIVNANVALTERIGIVENEKRSFEPYAVLAKILRALVSIPLKAHG
jgi:hypothetical protein